MTTDTLRQITGILRTPEGSPFPNKTLTWFRERRVVQTQGSSVVLDEPFYVVTDAAGAIDHMIMAGNYLVLVRLKDTDRYFRVAVPDQAGPLNIADLVDQPAVEQSIITQVQELILKARAWAETPEDTEVAVGQYSALHHSAKAAAQAVASAASATQAALYDGPWLDTVTALLADTTLTYTPGASGVTAGEIVRTRAEGFSYQVAASGAVDHHITTAGGVKLTVLTPNVMAFGATGNGTTDDTAAIQAAINAHTIVYFPAGHYRHDGTITVPSRRFLYGAGQDVTRLSLLNTVPANGWGLKVLNAEDVTIADMSLEGNVARLTPPFTFSGGPFGSGLIVQNSQRVKVQRVSSTDWAKHCFDVSANAYTSPDANTYLDNGRSRHVWIDLCYAKGAGDDNFTTHQSDHIRISNCFSESPSGLYVANNSNCYEIDDGSRHVQLVNVFARDGVCGIQVKGHTGQPAPQNVLIDGAHIDGCNYGVDCYNTGLYGDGTDTDGPTYSSTALGLTLKNIHISDVKQARVTGEENPFAIRIRSYASVIVDGINIINATAGSYYLDSLILFLSGVRNLIATNIQFSNCSGFAYGVYTTQTVRRASISGVYAAKCNGLSASAALVRLTTPGNVTVEGVQASFSTNLGTIESSERLFAPSVGSNAPHVVQTESRSSDGSGAQPTTTISHGWVEGGVNLGAGEGNVWEFTCQLSGEASPTRVAAIRTSKVDALDTSKTHDLIFETRNAAGALVEGLRLGAEGHVVLSGLGNFASDAAAATDGVPVGGIYRNGSALKIRVS